MLSTIQRTKILGDIQTIASSLGLTVLPERQKIENSTEFPLIQTTFQTEGKRQYYWRSQLHEYQLLDTHKWETVSGHYAQASISIQIKSLDVDELELKSYQFANAFWKQAVNWTFENTSQMEFRGGEAPHFLPPYLLKEDERKDVYTCNIDFFVDYEFSWSVFNDPITNIITDSSFGKIASGDLVDNSDLKAIGELIQVAPGCYVMNGELTGNDYCLQYRAGGIII
jgi:hypothetical protein